jgi:cellulose synthase/poly-beta-1,6-N-acetylglucosamine synthase-like glycosyltransferase
MSLSEMSGKPLASIVVITYNDATVIEECLSSLIAQSYPNKEIIVVYDEGSKDGTKEVLERLAASYKGSFRVISVPHIGRSKARNIGWRNSRGEVIFFVDADDIFFKDCLEKAVLKLESDPRIGCVCLTGSSLTTGKGFLAGCMEVYSRLQQTKVEKGIFKPSWAEVYRREALEKVGGFDESLERADDKDLFIRVTGAGYEAGLVTGVNWLYRRPVSLSAYLRKIYLRGVKRIPFMVKHREWGKLLLKLLSFWLLVLLLALSVLYTSAFLLMLTCFTIFMIVNIIRVARLVWSKMSMKRYIFLYPIFSIITHLFLVVGHIHGLVSFFFKEKNPKK